MRILITGSNGYVAKHLLSFLLREGHSVDCLTRHPFKSTNLSAENLNYHSVDYSDLSSLRHIFESSDAIVHLAGRAHYPNDKGRLRCFNKYREANVLPSVQLAKLAAETSVKRFIFVSTIGVHHYSNESPLVDEDSPLSPSDYYAKSKLEAELRIHELLCSSSTGLITLRPPLIYGQEAPGNLLNLALFLKRFRVNLFSSFNVKRSFLSVSTFVEMLNLCLTSDRVSTGTFVLSDQEDISVSDVCDLICKAESNRTIVSLAVPRFVLFVFALLLGRLSQYKALAKPLVINSSSFSLAYGWRPLGIVKSDFPSI